MYKAGDNSRRSPPHRVKVKYGAGDSSRWLPPPRAKVKPGLKLKPPTIRDKPKKDRPAPALPPLTPEQLDKWLEEAITEVEEHSNDSFRDQFGSGLLAIAYADAQALGLDTPAWRACKRKTALRRLRELRKALRDKLTPMKKVAERINEDLDDDKELFGPPDDPRRNRNTHNADFTMVVWCGVEYHFAIGVQASAVKALWEEWERSGLGLHQQTIRNAVDAERDNFRIDTVFRNHPAFKTMIQRCGDGRYKLAKPDPSANPAKPKRKKNRKITPKSRQRRV